MSLTRKGIYRGLDVENMEFFDAITLDEVQHLAAGLEHEEVLAYYGLTVSEVQTSDQDWFYFCKAYNKGRTDAKRKAVDSLFQSMRSDKGKEASIAYLKHFGSSQWRESKETDGSDKNFKFTVTLPPDTSY
jgi:hypothetical protein